MRWIRGIRAVAPWVLAIFVVAQLSGLIPGHYEHAGPTAGHAMMHAPSLGAGSAHHHVLGDLSDECCAVHAMPAIAIPADVPSPDLTPERGNPAAKSILTPVQLTPLDPPPKLS